VLCRGQSEEFLLPTPSPKKWPATRSSQDLAPMKTKTHFAFRIDVWDSAGNGIAEHLAGLEDYAMAVAAYWAAIQSRPKDKIMRF
jgi:hypothetical protein